MDISSDTVQTLDLPPSCIEVCPAYPEYFLVGTYNLEKEDPLPREPPGTEEGDEPLSSKRQQSRNGSIVVFHLGNLDLNRIQTLTQPSAILDLHFHPFQATQHIAAVVSSTGTLSIFKLDPGRNKSSPLQQVAIMKPSGTQDGVLFLSFAWHPTDSHLMAITTSNGKVLLLRLNSALDHLVGSQTVVMNHTLESWCVAFSSPAAQPILESSTEHGDAEPFTIYSGGDDAALLYTSCVVPAGLGQCFQLQTLYPELKLSNHGAGVTAILPLPMSLSDGWSLVGTGSYDDYVRIFAIQPPHISLGIRRARLLSELNLGGGVWRLKLIEASRGVDSKARILASCMHAGVRVLELSKGATDEGWDIEVVGKFEEHRSMNYGSDFIPNLQDGRLVCLSTSFYDKLLCLWQLQIRT